MSYIGKAPGFGIRNRYYYTATASQTTFSGADDNGQTLAYADSKYLDVYLNGVLLVAGTDYTATTLTSVTLTSGAAASDIVEIVAYDIFSVADTVSAANGGTFSNDIDVTGTVTSDGADLDGAVVINESGADVDFRVESDTGANALFVEGSSGNVGIGTSSPSNPLHVYDASVNGVALFESGDTAGGIALKDNSTTQNVFLLAEANDFYIQTNTAERMRLTSGGQFLVGKTSTGGGSSIAGVEISQTGSEFSTNDGRTVCIFNRNDNDGTIISLRQADTQEGTISVSGTTVSYNGGHLSRWSRLADDSKDTSIVKGTVMTNLDEMVEWRHEAVEAQDAVYDEEGNVVSEAVEAKEAYTEDNEQLNKMAVSSVEGDSNVAGVFVNWDESDDFNDMNIAMTGDMVIRIAQGTTVARGDLLMSAGDGTAKPQGDDIVRSKTIAKVTSTHVSHTYDDGSYLVPCVLMAC